jgi:hypothetical protein
MFAAAVRGAAAGRPHDYIQDSQIAVFMGSDPSRSRYRHPSAFC